MAQREPGVLLLFIVAGAGMMLLFAASLLRVHPLVIWWTLGIVLFGISQAFPSNHRDRTFLAIASAVVAAVITWLWHTRMTPGIRDEYAKALSGREVQRRDDHNE